MGARETDREREIEKECFCPLKTISILPFFKKSDFVGNIEKLQETLPNWVGPLLEGVEGIRY